MNALSLYVNTFRMVLHASPEEVNSWAEIYGLMTCLRQSLLCCVCGKLLIVPSCSSDASCQHNVCKHCIGGKTLLRPICDFCSDYQKYTENIQLRLVLQCYKKMCKYIMTCAFYKNMGFLNGERSVRLSGMVREGAELEDEYHYLNVNCNKPCDKHLTKLSNVEVHDAGATNGKRTIYSILLNDAASPSLMIKKSTFEDTNEIEDYKDTDEDTNSSDFLTECLMSARERRKQCRCGMATQNPGKLTCCGQRCPCYVGGRACFDCQCRGCRNPQQINVASSPTQNFHSNFAADDDSSNTSSSRGSDTSMTSFTSDTENSF